MSYQDKGGGVELIGLISKRARKICTVLVAVALTLALAAAGAIYQTWFGPTVTVSTEITNWGLSFPTPGQPPVGNATSEQLAPLAARYLGDPNEPIIYLTFDAGFENGNTSAILDALKKHNAPAAFFLVGNYLETAPDLVRRMVEEGHVVGNHTLHHPDMSKIADLEAFRQELIGVETLFKEVTGQDMPKIYRPPQGKFNWDNLKQAQALGYTTFFWSLAYVDWYTDNQPSKEQAFDKLIPRIHNGAIVLLHSTSETNAKILDELLTRWEQAGYHFGKLTDLTMCTSQTDLTE